MDEKQKELDKLKQEIINNDICPLLRKQATQLVFGDGNPSSDIVFIGEAPGKNEDLKGLPFVGAAGKFLDEMLDIIGLNRSDVYITNIVKYRPPNNRDPLPSEKSAFIPYLRMQLEIIKPKIVVTLGRHSMNCFLPGMHISDIHGQPKRITLAASGKLKNGLKVVIMPLFHPAAALYNGQMRQTLIEDFSLIPNVIESISKQGITK
ncbi:MAG: uracil-DNA glycosylase family protein [Candidatus Saccharimonadales bacterium]